MLTITKCISDVPDLDGSIQYTWNDPNPAGAYGHEVASLENKIAKLPKRAIVALAAAFAEWIGFRLRNHPESVILLNYTEAVWAAIIDLRYRSDMKRPSRAEWKGTIKGPSWVVMKLLDSILEQAHVLEPCVYETVCISNLAEYMLINPDPFKRWRKKVIDRLLVCYPLDANNKLGLPVAREAFDPDFDFKPEMRNELIEKFIAGLDYTGNPYLKLLQETRVISGNLENRK